MVGMDKHTFILVELARCYGWKLTFSFDGGPADVGGPRWNCLVDRGREKSVACSGITINHSAFKALGMLPPEITEEFLND